jgi:hypothetical protein
MTLHHVLITKFVVRCSDFISFIFNHLQNTSLVGALSMPKGVSKCDSVCHASEP